MNGFGILQHAGLSRIAPGIRQRKIAALAGAPLCRAAPRRINAQGVDPELCGSEPTGVAIRHQQAGRAFLGVGQPMPPDDGNVVHLDPGDGVGGRGHRMLSSSCGGRLRQGGVDLLPRQSGAMKGSQLRPLRGVVQSFSVMRGAE